MDDYQKLRKYLKTSWDRVDSYSFNIIECHIYYVV